MGVIVEGIPGWAARIESQPALSAEVELELARRTRAGDREARDRLLSANLRYALRYAKSLARYGVSVAELTNEGVIGLMEAVERFDPERGVRFATYAAGWIRALVLERLVRQKSPIGHAGGAFRTKYWFALRRERAKLLQRGISGDELTRCVAMLTPSRRATPRRSGRPPTARSARSCGAGSAKSSRASTSASAR